MVTIGPLLGVQVTIPDYSLMINGYRGYYYKDYYYYVRCFQLLENCFDPSSLSAAGTGGGDVPQVGYVMYDDKSWGSADD